jgi:hypothetical protein
MQHEEVTSLVCDGLKELQDGAAWQGLDQDCAGGIQPMYEDLKTIANTCRAQDDTKTRALGLQRLMESSKPFCVEYVQTVYNRFKQESHPFGYIAALFEGVNSNDAKMRKVCMKGLTGHIRLCYAKHIYGDKLETYFRTQGRIVRGPINPNFQTHEDKDITKLIVEQMQKEADMFIIDSSTDVQVCSKFDVGRLNRQ